MGEVGGLGVVVVVCIRWVVRFSKEGWGDKWGSGILC